MLGSIGNTVSNFAGNFTGNLLDRLVDLAPSLLTTALSAAANQVLPGSGALVQAFAGPIVEAAVYAFENAFHEVVMPAIGDSLGGMDADQGQLANSFFDGLMQGLGA
ncbi:hypothetical protein WCE55_03570 [Luteimonas sp. MJ293]|uniref:hypothetical protein n=1 Tax=Luteimonas sp. MJ146 TaxID=3129240 RepID=UPI0031BAE677